MGDVLDQGSKMRRSTRACLQCRSRKQRCHGESENATSPCERCRIAGKGCSFETEGGSFRAAPRYHPYEASSPSSAAVVVDQLRSELMDHRARLESLENALGISPARAESMSSASPPSAMDVSRPSKKPFSMDGISLGAPIATLRTLASLSEDEGGNLSDQQQRDQYSASPIAKMNAVQNSSSAFDPVAKGVLSAEHGQKLFDIYFLNCHSQAPLLSKNTQHNAALVRQTSSLLFTTICSVGARYWNSQSSNDTSRNWLHPRYADIISLLDQTIMALLLRPTANDMTIEAVQSLLIYIQWMPLDLSKTGPPCGRFNDISAWSIIGFAIRAANFICLERSVDAPFNSPNDITDEHMRRMRVWMTLLSIDHHLTLTARLPASLDPVPAARVARLFGSSPRAESNDLKVAGLCELVAVVHRAMKYSGDASLSAVDPVSLQKANSELDDWESVWSVVLPNSGFEHFNTQMPFTALRWYRLGLNAISLGPAFFGRNYDDIQNTTPATLRISIESATAMLYCFSNEERGKPPPLSFPINAPALASFRYSIDAYWVTHAFAVVFLALAYERGVVDDELNVLAMHIPNHRPSPPTASPRDASVLYRLVRLATDIFDVTATHPPADHYRGIVQNTFEALTKERGERGEGQQEVGDIFAAIMEEGFDWTFDSSAAVAWPGTAVPG